MKSYCFQKDALISNIYSTFSEDTEEKNFKKEFKELQSLNLSKIEIMDFHDFYIFYENLYAKDWKYIKTEKLYGIKIFFDNNSICWKENKLYPIYPWKKKFIIALGDKKIKDLEEIEEKKKKLKIWEDNIKKREKILRNKENIFKKKYKSPRLK